MNSLNVFHKMCDCISQFVLPYVTDYPIIFLRIYKSQFVLKKWSSTKQIKVRRKTYRGLSKNVWHLNCPFFQRVLVNKVKNREIFEQSAIFGAPFVNSFSWMLLYNTCNILTTSHCFILNRLSLPMFGDLPDLLAWVPHPHLAPLPPHRSCSPHIPLPHIPHNPHHTTITTLPSSNSRNNLLSLLSSARTQISRQVRGGVQNSPKPRNPNLRILSAYQR